MENQKPAPKDSQRETQTEVQTSAYPVVVPQRKSYKKLSLVVGVLSLALSLGVAVHHFRNHTFVRQIAQLTPLAPIFTPVPSPSFLPSPIPEASPTLPPIATSSAVLDKTYTNDQYGFSFDYPSNYKLLPSSPEYPHAVALLYVSGQSYDLTVEVATSSAEYENLNGTTDVNSGYDAEVKSINNLYVLLDNIGLSPDINKVIQSFKFTDGQLNQTFTSSDQRVTLTYFSNWIKTGNDLQGPHQRLRILGAQTPTHDFDDFTTTDTTISVAGKTFAAKKWTSDSWKSSFIEANIGDEEHPLYIQYGDAASVGFSGYEQKYDAKVNFEEDIKPVEAVLNSIQIL